MLDVTFFKNPRFSAASIAVTLVFFAMFGSIFFLSQYIQFVLGFSPLKAGAALHPGRGRAHDQRAARARSSSRGSAPRRS